MAESADALDSKSSEGKPRGGSSPPSGTTKNPTGNGVKAFPVGYLFFSSPQISRTSLAAIQLLLFSQIQKDDMRRVPDGSVAIGEIQLPSGLVHLKDGDIVCTLIPAVQEITSRIETETARVISPSPFISHPGQFAFGTNRKDADTVMQTVTCVDKFSIRRNEDF